MGIWQRHRRRTTAILLSAGLLAGFLPATVARADQVSDAKAAVSLAQDKIDQLQEQADRLGADLEDAQAALVDAQAAVEESKGRIAELEGKLDQLTGALGDLAVKTFISGDQTSGTGSLLTGAGTVTEVVEREEYAQLAMSEGQSSTDEMDATLTDLDNEQKNLKTRQNKAEQLIETVKNNQAATDKAQKRADDYLVATQQKYGQALVDEAARRQRELLAKAKAEQAAAAARIAKAAANKSKGGGNTGGGAAVGGTSNNGGGGGNAGGDTGGGDTSGDSGNSGGSGNSSAGKYVPPPSPGAGGAVQAAQSQVGVGYSYATASPGVAFDCSGLTAWAWEQAGVSLPHQSRAQYAATNHVSPSEAQPGDLIFFYSPISHVGLYIGGGMMVDAANHTLGVRQTAVNWGKVVGVGRPG